MCAVPRDQPLKSLAFEPRESVSLTVQQSVFTNGSDYGLLKPAPDSGVLGVPEVPPAGTFPPALTCPKAFVKVEKLIPTYQFDVLRPPRGHQLTDLEVPGYGVVCVVPVTDFTPQSAEVVARHQKLGGCLIAEFFDDMIRWLKRFKLGNAIFPDEYMRQFVAKSKHLSSHKIRTVYKDKWGIFVHKRKPLKLITVEFAAGVISHYSVEYHEYTSTLNMVSETPEGAGPRTVGCRPTARETEGVVHSRCHVLW